MGVLPAFVRTDMMAVVVVRSILWVFMKIVHFLYIPVEVIRLFEKQRYIPPITDDTLLIPAVILADKIRRKEISSETVVKAYIARIKEVNSVLNAVVEDRFEAALEDARNVDKMINEFPPDSQLAEKFPLLGVPITVKSSIAVEGLNNSAGVVVDKIAMTDAVVVKKARKAGAIPLLVSNTPELCLNWETTNKLTGTTVNPYDSRRTVGGSSGGEAALLSSGASLLGIGSDVAGSLRLPAHYCGVWGHKPTPKLVSVDGHYPGSDQKEWPYVFHLGPMARYAIDLPLLLDVLSEDHMKNSLAKKPVNLKKIKVYYTRQINSSLMSRMSDDVSDAIDRVINHFNSICDEKCQKVDFEFMKYASELSYLKLLTIDNVENLFKGRGEGSRAELLRFLTCRSKFTFTAICYGLARSLMHLIPETSLKAINSVLEQLRQDFLKILDGNSVYIIPTFPKEAGPHGDVIKNLFDHGYCSIFNPLGFPVTNCPITLSENGVPIGLQVVAAPNSDHLTLAIAIEIEKAFGGWRAPPSLEQKSILSNGEIYK